MVGLYLNPPDAAVVLCVDEKTQIQALDRTAPILPLTPGTPQRRTHGYRRYGTTNLHAALDTATGHIITSMTRCHRAEEFRKFLNLINREVPPTTRRTPNTQQRSHPQVLQGHSWAPTLSNDWKVNVGTIPPVPLPAGSELVGGKACCRLMPVGWAEDP